MPTLQSVLMAIAAEAENADWNSWENRPMMFEISREDDDSLTVGWLDVLNASLDMLCAHRTAGDVETAVLIMAGAAEHARSRADFGAPDELTGIGIRAEGWRHEGLNSEPIQSRLVQFHERGGSSWFIQHDRGGDPVVLSPATENPELSHALTRMLNAICPEGSPVYPLERS